MRRPVSLRAAWLLPLVIGCAEDRTLLSVPVHLSPSPTTLALADGVTIELTTASLTLSDLRLEAPAETASVRRSWSLIPTAHAHPGHDFAGEVAGELTGTWAIDLLGEDTPLGEAACYDGAYATARLHLLPEPVAVLEGTATVDGQARPFSFAVAPDQEITGLPFEATLDADAPPAGIALSVDLAHALSFVDWTTPDDDGDDLLTTADGELDNTVLFGVVSSPTFSVSLED
jgi:hypothetical protein